MTVEPPQTISFANSMLQMQETTDRGLETIPNEDNNICNENDNKIMPEDYASQNKSEIYRKIEYVLS